MVRRGELPPTTQQVFAQVLDGGALVELAEHTLDDPGDHDPAPPGLDTQPTTGSSWCGVNRPLARDITCRTHDSTAGSPGIDYILTQCSVGRASYGTIHSFGFGHLDNAKYPLVETRTTWPGSPVLVTERFRGWDTRK